MKFDAPAGEPLAKLEPSPKLVDLVKRSRELAVAEADVGDA
jgi:CRISPR-associated protein Csb1